LHPDGFIRQGKTKNQNNSPNHFIQKPYTNNVPMFSNMVWKSDQNKNLGNGNESKNVISESQNNLENGKINIKETAETN